MESDSETNKLTDSEDEAQALTVNLVVAATRSGKEFTKEYDPMAVDPAEANVHILTEAVQIPPRDLAGTSKQGRPPTLPPPLAKPIKRSEVRFSKPLDKINKVVKPI